MQIRFQPFPPAAALAALAMAAFPALGQQAQAPYRAPRTADGKPNLNGIWQAMNNANWDLEGHAARMPAKEVVGILGAQFATPPDVGVVEGGTIPYLPAALQKKKDNFANRVKLDPEVKCYMPGVPRATYMPYPFQIVQSTQNIMIVYEYAGSVRVVNMGAPTKAPADSWMGWSNGHWEGESLVVDVTSQVEDTWFDRSGDYHSDALHVVERYTPRSPETMMYEATIEDPKVFSRPWKISMPLYRHVEKNAQLMEFKCVEFAEEVLYGRLRKPGVKPPE
ncbi:MAG TPA: hypothetical protein VKV74_11560 [Bryobacteraceae bacterium]|nr:hypothetical protein [Bryobacteraceae bacterium]